MGMRSEDNLKRIIVELGSSENQNVIMFNSIEGFSKDDSANPELLTKIINGVKRDFVVKCVAILNTCGVVPCSLSTYEIFNNWFSFDQHGDVTASSEEKSVYKFTISDSEDIDEEVKAIVVKYNKTHNDEPVDEDQVHRMFGSGEFPFLCVRYAWHEGREEWHYTYKITR